MFWKYKYNWFESEKMYVCATQTQAHLDIVALLQCLQETSHPISQAELGSNF